MLRRGGGGDLGRADRHSHVRRGRNNRHNEREHQKSLNDLDDDDNFSMRFQSLEEVVGQVRPSSHLYYLCSVLQCCQLQDSEHLCELLQPAS